MVGIVLMEPILVTCRFFQRANILCKMGRKAALSQAEKSKRFPPGKMPNNYTIIIVKLRNIVLTLNFATDVLTKEKFVGNHIYHAEQ